MQVKWGDIDVLKASERVLQIANDSYIHTHTNIQVKWGDIDVLKASERVLQITNDSLIPAEVQTLIMKRNSRFKIDVASLSLAPGQKASVTLTATLDDTQPFRDELVLVVTEGGQIKVPLTAKGIGTTIWTQAYDLGAQPLVDMGLHFTSRNSKKSFVVRNRGPKPQTLTWFNATAAEVAYKAKQVADGKKKKEESSEEHKVQVCAM